MKKLLVATSALVAAGSAAALEVTLGGEVEAVVKYEKDAWSQSAPAATLSLDITGDSMGWSYNDVKTEVDAVAADQRRVSRPLAEPGGAELFISSDALGKVTLAGSCVTSLIWTTTRLRAATLRQSRVVVLNSPALRLLVGLCRLLWMSITWLQQWLVCPDRLLALRLQLN